MATEVVAEPGLSYETVLEAVQESSRGRWFLNEFKSRNGGVDTGQILGAIARLEARMESLAPGAGGAAGELARVRQAIAATRQDILKSSGAPGLSEEGKLFAHLAELARKSLSQNAGAAVPESIVQALRLIDQIDSSLNGGAAQAAPSAEKYFHRDNDLFQPQAAPAKPAPASQPAAAPASPPVETPVLGAKLVISRGKPAEMPKAEIPRASNPEAAQSAGTTAQPELNGHPRIVIIRRKPEDMPSPAAEMPVLAENAA